MRQMHSILSHKTTLFERSSWFLSLLRHTLLSRRTKTGWRETETEEEKKKIGSQGKKATFSQISFTMNFYARLTLLLQWFVFSHNLSFSWLFFSWDSSVSLGRKSVKRDEFRVRPVFLSLVLLLPRQTSLSRHSIIHHRWSDKRACLSLEASSSLTPLLRRYFPSLNSFQSLESFKGLSLFQEVLTSFDSSGEDRLTFHWFSSLWFPCLWWRETFPETRDCKKHHRYLNRFVNEGKWRNKFMTRLRRSRNMNGRKVKGFMCITRQECVSCLDCQTRLPSIPWNH